MSNKETHTQCLMKKGNTYTTSWIPSKFAVYNTFVKLKNGEVWEDGWEIVKIFNELESKVVNERSQDYKRARKASDV